MDYHFRVRRSQAWQWGVGALAGLLIVGVATREVGATPSAQPPQVPAIISAFEDVPDTSIYAPFINNLYAAGIVSGYTCGGTNPATGASEPCVAPANRPYYRPGSTVSRQQMSKFIDLGRRNIADATGTSLSLSGPLTVAGATNGSSLSLSGPLTVAGATTGSSLRLTGVLTGTSAVLTNSLYISSTAYIPIHARTTSGGEAVRGECLTPGANCYAVEGYTGVAGNYAAYFYGGKGVYAGSQDASAPGVDALANGTGAYGVSAVSDNYRGAYAARNNPAFYGLYVDSVAGESGTDNVADFQLGVRVVGNLTVLGSKSGYVVDAMQNVDGTALEAGDVVVIVGNSAPVLGEIPVVTVKKATSANDTAVAGVVDQALYVPDAVTLAAYTAQQDAQRAAMAARRQVESAAQAQGTKPDYAKIAMPQITISDSQGTVHATTAGPIASGSYANVVTLGAYKAVKVDASFGAIKAGDLLTSSPHAGYAMKVTDKAAANGAVIGKALGDLSSGTGLIPLMVTLK
ncbi:MAG: S-layer homology domain-containing protein [Chloroflexota bacterium]|nr:S-layer homology domain-containing protein [Chloroflexota bacterium]